MLARVRVLLVQSTNFNPCVGGRNHLGRGYGLANIMNNIEVVRKTNSIHWRRMGMQGTQSVLGFSTGRRQLLDSNNAFNSFVISSSSAALDFHCGQQQQRHRDNHHRRYVHAKASTIFDDQHLTDRGLLGVTKLAKEEAKRMGHNYVGTEHIFLGLIAQDNGIGAKLLQSFGISLNDAREKVEMIIAEEQQQVTKSSDSSSHSTKNDDDVCSLMIGESGVENKMIITGDDIKVGDTIIVNDDDSQDENVKAVRKRRRKVLKILIFSFLFLGFLALVSYILFTFLAYCLGYFFAYLFVYIFILTFVSIIPLAIVSALTVEHNNDDDSE